MPDAPHSTIDTRLHGLLAEFDEPDQLVAATRRSVAEGYRQLEALSPLPVSGLAEALRFRKTWIPLIVLLGGILGGAAAFWMQWWISVVAYPLNVGGRPLNSWPAFIPVTFELTILVAALAGVLGMLALNGLPRPHHPLFGVDRFARASRDKFFLYIEARDPRFDRQHTRAFLESLGPREVFDVPL